MVSIINHRNRLFSSLVFQNVRNFPDVINQIAAQATQLLAECDEEIKTHTVTQTSNAVVTALPAVCQTMKVIEKGKALEEKISSTATSAKLTAMVTAFQITMMAMQKINQATTKNRTRSHF